MDEKKLLSQPYRSKPTCVIKSAFCERKKKYWTHFKYKDN